MRIWRYMGVHECVASLRLGFTDIEHSRSVGSSPAELLMSCSTDEPALRKTWRKTGTYTGRPQGQRASVERLYRTIETSAAATYDHKAAALFARFVRNGTWHVPTLVMDVRRSSTNRR